MELDDIGLRLGLDEKVYLQNKLRHFIKMEDDWGVGQTMWMQATTNKGVVATETSQCTFVECEEQSEEGGVEQCKMNSICCVYTEEVRVRNEKS